MQPEPRPTRPLGRLRERWRSRPFLGASLRLGLGLAAALVVVAQVRSCQDRPRFDPVTDADYRRGGRHDPAAVELGRFLFFDRELSGNRTTACAGCHDPLSATTERLSLSLGQGAEGLGAARLPRNAPALFNLGALEVRSLFHDGRVAVDPGAPSGLSTPAGAELPHGLDGVLAAQALFPTTTAAEMAGRPGENEVADAVHRGAIAGAGGAWDLLAGRLRAIPGYVDLFVAAFADVRSAEDITMVHAANAIAAFVATAFRSDESPFDRYLRGDADAMTPSQTRGMKLFYGGGGRCSRCHAGAFQTDQLFHSIAAPQIGPGTGGGADGRDDFGRENVTGDPTDRYRFRTPSLRNVELTGPWGHAGAYGTLEAMLEHYRRPAAALLGYDRTQAILPSPPARDPGDFAVMADPARIAALLAAGEAQSLQLSQLTSEEVADLLAFLNALTDPRARDLRHVIPDGVPSGRMMGPRGARAEER